MNILDQKTKKIRLTALFISLNILQTSPTYAQDQHNSQVTKQEISTKEARLSECLAKIEEKIHDAYIIDKQKGKCSELTALLLQLNSQNNLANNRHILYWKAYIYYHKTLVLNDKDEDLAEEENEKGIQLLEEMKDKGVEEYALLSYLLAQNIPFQSWSRLSVAKKMKKYGLKALELSPNNLRANLVNGINDFKRPRIFGGGKKVEALLLKAIHIKDDLSRPKYLPSWVELCTIRFLNFWQI